MAKKNGFNPLILMTMPTPQPTTVVGGGSGQSTPDLFACGFDDWMNLFAEDNNNDGVTNFEDYRRWFQNHFGEDRTEGQELWEQVGNTGNLFP